MNKIEQFRITGMTISGFKSYEGPTELTFGDPTVITGGNGRGKTSIADAIAFVVTGLPSSGSVGSTGSTTRTTLMFPFRCALWMREARPMS
ncbi:MAG: AAA family ATPase [Oscillospiraceae bacterium]